MSIADCLLSGLQTMIWPVVVICLVLIFKSDIHELLKGLRKAKFPGGEVEFVGYGGASIDKAAQEPVPVGKGELIAEGGQPKENSIKWNNSGDLFWLGHNLMYAIDLLLRGAGGGPIGYTLQKSLDHARSLGFEGSPVESRLARLINLVERMREEDWTAELRNNYAAEVHSLVEYIGYLVGGHQEGLWGQRQGVGQTVLG